MKKILTLLMLATFSVAALAQDQAEIKFDELKHNFGTFTSKNPVQECTFTFTNVGTAPLVINQAIASCGCTVPQYTKAPIAPGQKGTIKVTYNGAGQTPGHIKKGITVRTNGKIEVTRLYIEGEMLDSE